MANWLKSRPETASSLVQAALESYYKMETVLFGTVESDEADLANKLNNRGVSFSQEPTESGKRFCRVYLQVLSVTSKASLTAILGNGLKKNVILLTDVDKNPIETSAAIISIAKAGAMVFLDEASLLDYLESLND